MTMRWMAEVLAVALGVMGCAAEDPALVGGSEPLPYYDSPEFTPRWFDADLPPEDFHRVPAFALLDQHGTTLTEADLDGQITVVAFFFTSCGGICPKLREGLRRVDSELPADAPVQIYAHSVTPSTDTVGRLRAYAKKNEITSPRWHLLTGEREVIYDLGRNAYFAEEDLGEQRDADDFLHTESLVLVDGQRRIRGIYNGLGRASVGALIEDAARLLGEAPRG